ncbi:MAG: hypothetical protein IKF59_03995 [Lachnospiraceae bacterium]|jgi:NAD-dependent DNA ligase|nr:hypothetical protein [Lachnospiraceae bacterium]
MGDIGLKDYEQARRWKDDVDRITQQIEELLKKIESATAECVSRMGDNLGVKHVFEDMNEAVATVFQNLLNTLQKVVETLKNILDIFVKKLTETADSIKNATSRIQSK